MTTTTTTASTTPGLGARELFCGACGYGIVIRRDPPACPMCRSSRWVARPTTARWN
jgi:hypothetical protein